MNGKLQLEQALETECLSGVSPRTRPSSAVAGSVYIFSCVAVAAVGFGDDFVQAHANPINIKAPLGSDYVPTQSRTVFDFSPALEDSKLDLPGMERRVRLPLIRSKNPGSVALTNAQIEDLLD